MTTVMASASSSESTSPAIRAATAVCTAEMSFGAMSVEHGRRDGRHERDLGDVEHQLDQGDAPVDPEEEGDRERLGDDHRRRLADHERNRHAQRR